MVVEETYRPSAVVAVIPLPPSALQPSKDSYSASPTVWLGGRCSGETSSAIQY